MYKHVSHTWKKKTIVQQPSYETTIHYPTNSLTPKYLNTIRDDNHQSKTNN